MADVGKSVGKCRKHLAGRLLIADSKKAYNRSEGLGHLERTSLAVLECMGKRPADLVELLMLLCPDCLPRLAEYPWYQDMQQCRLAAGTSDAKIAAKVFAEDLQAHGAALVRLRTCCLDVAYYNRMVNTVRNKAQVLFIAVTQLIQALLNEFPREDIHVQIDRQGGRAHYRENLLRSFPDMELTIVQEGDECSVYEMRQRDQDDPADVRGQGRRPLSAGFAGLHDQQVCPRASHGPHEPVLREVGCRPEADGGILAGWPAVCRGTADSAAPSGDRRAIAI